MPIYVDSKFDGDIIDIGYYNVDNIKNIVFNNLDKFTITNRNINNTDNIIRRSRTHNNTNHLTLFFEDNQRTPTTIESYNNDIYLLLEKDIENIKNKIQLYYQNPDLIIARGLITLLKPNTNIPKHKDSGYILEKGHRIHIPLKTNKNILFGVGNTTKNLLEGNIYEINNCRTHWVINNSTENRYHLILDLIDPKILF